MFDNKRIAKSGMLFWVSPILYLCAMFVRQKKNPSGVVSVQVIGKSAGKYKMLKSIGSSSNPHEVVQLCRKGEEWIRSYGGQLDMLPLFEKEHLPALTKM
jgi:hypothetical protein